MEPSGVVAYRSEISGTLYQMSRAIVVEYGDNSHEFEAIESIGEMYCDYSDTKSMDKLREFIKAITAYQPPRTRTICAAMLRFKIMSALARIQQAYMSSIGISI